MLSLFTQFVTNYSYEAASSILKDGRGPLWDALRQLCRMQQNRLAFDFAEAMRAWEQANEQLPADLAADPSFQHARVILQQLLNGEASREQVELAQLVELFRHLELYLQIEDTASFLIRFYRAREAVLTFVAHHYGIERVRTGSIHEYFVQLEEAMERDDSLSYLGAYFFWKSKNVSDTMNLRNRSFIGHGRMGFSESRVWEEYSGYAMQTVALSKRRFIRDASLMLRDLGAKLDSNFEMLNGFILAVAKRTMAAELLRSRREWLPVCRELVLSGHYRSVAALLQPKPTSELAQLLTFAEHLQNCYVMNVPRDMGLVIATLQRFRSDPAEVAWCKRLLGLHTREQRTFVMYLYSFAQLLDERGMTVDFVVIFFRLVEELLLYVIGWDVNGEQRLVEGKHRRAIGLYEGEKVATFSVYKRALTRHVHGLQRKHRALTEEEQLYADVLALVSRPEVANVLELRHEGVSGHGFADLSRDRILAVSGGVEPLLWLQPLLARLELVPEYSVFRLVDEALLLLLHSDD
jgi:hypothetical protein